MVVVLASLYLVGLGMAAFTAPAKAKRFLHGLASTAPLHFAELAVRMLVGAALVLNASAMLYPKWFDLFGWLLIGTTVVLAVLPWRMHRRFASWSVPWATRSMSLFGIGSLAGGLLLLAALFPSMVKP